MRREAPDGLPDSNRPHHFDSLTTLAQPPGASSGFTREKRTFSCVKDPGHPVSFVGVARSPQGIDAGQEPEHIAAPQPVPHDIVRDAPSQQLPSGIDSFLGHSQGVCDPSRFDAIRHEPIVTIIRSQVALQAQQISNSNLEEGG